MSYKYYLHERPATPGTIPPGSLRIDEQDLGGRYGAVYYENPLAPRIARQYELLPAAADQPELDAYFLKEPLEKPPSIPGLVSYTEAPFHSLNNPNGEVVDGKAFLVFDHQLTEAERHALPYLKKEQRLSRDFGLDRIRLEEATFARKLEARLRHVLEKTETSGLMGRYYQILRENLETGMSPQKADTAAVCQLVTDGTLKLKLVPRFLETFSPYIGLAEGNRRPSRSYRDTICQAAEKALQEAQHRIPAQEPSPRAKSGPKTPASQNEQKEEAGSKENRQGSSKSGLAIESRKRERSIDDFGRKLIGKKNLFERYESAVLLARNADIANSTFAEAFPAPNYVKLTKYTEPWRVAAIRALRESLPKKPRYGVTQWAEAVRMHLDLASRILAADSTITLEDFFSLLQGNTLKTGEHILSKRLAYTQTLFSLYFQLGHESSLRDYQIRYVDPSKSYAVHHGIDYSHEYIIDELSFDRLSGAPRFRGFTGAHGKTVQEAVASLGKILEARRAATAEQGESEHKKKKMPHILVISHLDHIETKDDGRHPVYTYTFAYKKGSHYIPILPYNSFQTAEEARDYFTAHKEDVLTAYEKVRKIPSEYIDGAKPRSGAVPRRTHDITPEDLQKAFGLSGGQFGNWVEDKRRQEDLNSFYEAMLDLSDITGLPPKSLCFGNTLGLQFGSNGMARAKAHYDPQQIAINLNKKNGAGSLAHEWFHALDNLFARYRTEGKITPRFMTEESDVREASYGSGTHYCQPPGVAFTREAIVNAFGGLYRAIHKDTQLSERSDMLDLMSSKPYWGTDIELAARAFQSYVCYKLAEKGIQDDYLSMFRSKEDWQNKTSGTSLVDAYPYPTKDEMPAIAKAFDHLFETIKVKEAENGITLYSATHHADIPAMLQKSTIIPEEALTKKEREMQDLAAHLGVAMTFVEGPKALHGRYNPMDGSLLVNRKGTTSPQWTFAHECFHVMRQEDPFLYDELLISVEDVQDISKSQLDAYRQSIGAPDMDDCRAKEELLADAFANVQKEKELNQKLARQDAGLMCRFAAFTKKLLYHAQTFLHRREGSLTKDQFDAFKEHVEDRLHILRNKDGNRFIPKGVYVLGTVDALTRPDALESPETKARIKTEAVRLMLIDEKPKDIRTVLAAVSPLGKNDPAIETILASARRKSYIR